MIKRGYIRMLVVPTRTTYFVDKGVERGTAVDFARLYEDELNARIGAQHLMMKNLRVRVVFIPMKGDQILPALAEGKGDIAAANITVTARAPEECRLCCGGTYRRERNCGDRPRISQYCKCRRPFRQGSLRAQGNELLPEPPQAQRTVRRRGQAPVVLKEAPEALADEDLLEMLNAGLVPIVIVDRHIADFWKQIFRKL
jgi:membrane-bound lytic murein transglycosylase MltF